MGSSFYSEYSGKPSPGCCVEKSLGNAGVEAGHPVEKKRWLLVSSGGISLCRCGLVEIEVDKSTGFSFCFEYLGGACLLEGFGRAK